MNRRSFLSLLASAPIAALGPWEKLIQPQILGHRLGRHGLIPFVTLPTLHPITILIEVDGYLCAMTADETCWVINVDGEIVTSFKRQPIRNVTDDFTFDTSVYRQQ